MNQLNSLRSALSADEFKFLAATLTGAYYTDLVKRTGKKVKRTIVFDRVNLTLRSIGCEEVSYGFLRKLI